MNRLQYQNKKIRDAFNFGGLGTVSLRSLHVPSIFSSNISCSAYQTHGPLVSAFTITGLKKKKKKKAPQKSNGSFSDHDF